MYSPTPFVFKLNYLTPIAVSQIAIDIAKPRPNTETSHQLQGSVAYVAFQSQVQTSLEEISDIYMTINLLYN